MTSVQFFMECLLNEFSPEDMRQTLDKTRQGMDHVVQHIRELNQQKQQLQTELHRASDAHQQDSIRSKISGVDSLLMTQYALRKSYEHTIQQNEAKLRHQEEFLRNHPKFA